MDFLRREFEIVPKGHHNFQLSTINFPLKTQKGTYINENSRKKTLLVG